MTSERGPLVLVVLRLPHLVLPDVGDDERAPVGGAPQLVDDVRGVQPAVVVAHVRMSRYARSRRCIAPMRSRHGACGARPRRLRRARASDVAHVADEAEVARARSCRSRRDRSRRGSSSPWPRRSSRLPVTRSSKRMPSATMRSASWMAWLTHASPCMPIMPSASGCVAGKPPSPSSVAATGMSAFSASARSGRGGARLDDALADEQQRPLGVVDHAPARARARASAGSGDSRGARHRGRLVPRRTRTTPCCASLVMSTSTGPGRPLRAM